MRFLESVWITTCELAPWLLIGAVVTAMLHRLLPSGFISRNLQGRMGIVKSTLIGVPLPLCSCGVIPAGIGLKKDGASNGSAIAFLISTPQTGVDSVLVSAAMLGWPFALLKIAAALVTGIIGGVWVDLIDPRRGKINEENAKSNQKPTWNDAFNHGIQLLRSIWAWLVFGLLLSALLTTFLPANALAQVTSPVGALVAALFISTPLYVCATASVPIAASLVAGGLPLGAALVFLMAGPATNAATIGAVKSEFGSRNTLVYLAVVILGSILFGLAFDSFIQANIVAGNHSHFHEMEESLYAQISAVILLGLLVFFAWEEYRPTSKRNSDLTVNVNGMTCNGCVSKLKRHLMGVNGIHTVQIDLKPGVARVSGAFNALEVYDKVRLAGFIPQLPSDVLAVPVMGMTCGSCVGKISRRLVAEQSISTHYVNLEQKQLFVQGDCSEAELIEILEELGFQSGENLQNDALYSEKKCNTTL